jgi:hypothetical protein
MPTDIVPMPVLQLPDNSEYDPMLAVLTTCVLSPKLVPCLTLLALRVQVLYAMHELRVCQNGWCSLHTCSREVLYLTSCVCPLSCMQCICKAHE